MALSPIRHLTVLTGGWHFAPQIEPGQPMPPDAATVTVPHTVAELPWHGFDDAEYRIRSAYERALALPDAAASGRTFLRFEGVMVAADVTVDGIHLARHEGGFTPFEVELTDLVADGRAEVLLRVDVDSDHLTRVPPFGHRAGFLTFGGIYRDVTLHQRPAVHVADAVVRSSPTGVERRDVEVTVTIDAATGSNPPQPAERVGVELLDGGTVLAGGSVPLPDTGTGEARTEVTLVLPDVAGIVRWDLDRPHLHHLAVRLLAADGTVVDELVVRTGFRDAAFTPEGFVLNGRRVQLRGLNRHQIYPFVGAAMPARMQRRDAELLRRELGCNVVRTSHYPQSPHFLDACDELGLLVFEEIPGWQHVSDDPRWRELVLRDVEAMVVRDRNRPSVILWGTRINESQDDDELYTATAALARTLDPTRQTSGVRYFPTSRLLEDVYGHNDFFWPMLPPVAPRQLNTEFVGHTFPTRQGDPSDRHVEHTLRHARVHDHLGSDPGYSGGIGWVAFDYQTGPEINAADRIDAHGVCDVFRHPKPAAAFYASQVDPGERVVLELVGSWGRGDAAEPSGRGQTPETERLVCSNCDRVEVLLDEVLHTTVYPDRDGFPHLPHPPFRLVLPTDRHRTDELRLVGYLGDEMVAERRYAGDGVDRDLRVWVDHDELVADGSDTTQLSFWVTDPYGNRRRTATGVVTVTAEGPVTVVGEQPFGLSAGGGALYLRAGSEPGVATVTVSHPRFGRREVEVRAVAPGSLTPR